MSISPLTIHLGDKQKKALLISGAIIGLVLAVLQALGFIPLIPGTLPRAHADTIGSLAGCDTSGWNPNWYSQLGGTGAGDGLFGSLDPFTTVNTTAMLGMYGTLSNITTTGTFTTNATTTISPMYGKLVMWRFGQTTGASVLAVSGNTVTITQPFSGVAQQTTAFGEVFNPTTQVWASAVGGAFANTAASTANGTATFTFTCGQIFRLPSSTWTNAVGNFTEWTTIPYAVYRPTLATNVFPQSWATSASTGTGGGTTVVNAGDVTMAWLHKEFVDAGALGITLILIVWLLRPFVWRQTR